MGQHASVHHVASKENLKALRKLLHKKGVDVNHMIDQKTALFNAVKENTKEAVDLLLGHRADPNVMCVIQRGDGYSFEWTAVHEACRQNNIEMLQSLLEHGGNADLHAHHQMTPVHVAAWHGHREAVKVLIDAGCDVNKLDRFQESALVIPICNGDTEIVETLLHAGCKLNTRAWGNLRKIRGKHEIDFRDTLTGDGPYSLFSLAILYSWLNVAYILLRHGYNPNKYQLYDLAIDVKASLGELGTDFNTLMHCMFDAGYKFKVREEQQLDCLLWPPHTGYSEELIAFLKSFNKVHSLQRICASCIRSKVRLHTGQKSIIKPIQSLNLPSSLKEYLCLEKYIDRNCDDACTKMQVSENPLYFAMPKPTKTKARHVYIDFWNESCCWSK